MITTGAILFDLDGTLIDSGDAVADAWTRFAHRIGAPPELILGMCHGVRTTEVIDSLDLVAPVMETALMVESWIVEAGSRPTPGALALMGQLADTGWGVVTSSLRPTATSRFEGTGLAWPPVMVTADDVARGKPDPSGYLQGAELLSMDPRDCLVVEDAPAGIQAGKAAGMRVLAVETTHSSDDLQAADFVVPDLSHVRLAVQGDRFVVTLPD